MIALRVSSSAASSGSPRAAMVFFSADVYLTLAVTINSLFPLTFDRPAHPIDTIVSRSAGLTESVFHNFEEVTSESAPIGSESRKAYLRKKNAAPCSSSVSELDDDDDKEESGDSDIHCELVLSPLSLEVALGSTNGAPADLSAEAPSLLPPFRGRPFSKVVDVSFWNISDSSSR